MCLLLQKSRHLEQKRHIRDYTKGQGWHRTAFNEHGQLFKPNMAANTTSILPEHRMKHRTSIPKTNTEHRTLNVWQFCRRLGRLGSGWLAGWLAGWLPGWLAGLLAGWLAGWLASYTRSKHTEHRTQQPCERSESNIFRAEQNIEHVQNRTKDRTCSKSNTEQNTEHEQPFFEQPNNVQSQP